MTYLNRDLLYNVSYFLKIKCYRKQDKYFNEKNVEEHSYIWAFNNCYYSTDFMKLETHYLANNYNLHKHLLRNNYILQKQYKISRKKFYTLLKIKSK